MMLARLPPAGDPIVVRRAARPALEARWPGWRLSYYASGTAALAAGLRALVLRAELPRPRVIVPGYACPALVSAAIHAGAEPVFVDLTPERPWISLEALERTLDARTIAVVAVNFLGIPERLRAIRDRLEGSRAALVNDSAQAFPAAGPDPVADLTVLSFGRGKPVSLLGGGALACRDPALHALLPVPPEPSGSPLRLRAQAAAYNLLRRPQLYWLPQLLPLGLGETRYQPLHMIAAMDAERRRALAAAVDAYLARPVTAQRRLRALLAELGSAAGLRDLPSDCEADSACRLSRYPVLAASRRERDRLLTALARLGASKLYGRPLPDVSGMPARRPPPLPAASDFADRLLTLPLHEQVSPRRMAAIRAVLRCRGARPLFLSRSA